MIEIELADQQATYSFNTRRLIAAARTVLEEEGIRAATVSIAAVESRKMQQLNRDHLQHDYPTDVLSFLFERSDEGLDGEVIICPEVASQVVQGTIFSLEDELLLYVVHGILHLVGYDDQTADDRANMQNVQRNYLSLLDARVPQQSDAARDSSCELSSSAGRSVEDERQ